MAGIAGLAVIAVPRYIVMFVRQVDRVVMLVAVDAAEGRIISRRSMAFRALVPLTLMLAAVDREVLPVVIPGRRYPGGR